MKISGYEIVINTLTDNITFEKAIDRMCHNMREPKQTKKIKYLRRDTRANRYFVRNDYGALIEKEPSRSMSHEDIENKIKEMLLQFKKDYESQTITDKNGKSRKRVWQKKMTPFTEILLTFGTQRPKEENEGLNEEETKFINGLNILANAMDFINNYCKKYGVECVAAAEHNDEKTKHWQIIFSNYDFTKHACIRRDRKNMAIYGRDMQDMSADAFSGIAVRGVVGSKAIHKTLKQMHETELSYKSEQALKNDITLNFEECIDEAFDEKKSFTGKIRYEISKDGMEEFVKTISKDIYDLTKQNITIIKDTDLQNKIDELEKQLADKSEILARKNELELENELLHKEILELKELNETFENKDIVLAQKEEINGLKESLKQRDVAIRSYKSQILNSKEIINQAKADKEELARLKDIEAKKIEVEEEKEELEKEIKTYKELAAKQQKEVEELGQAMEANESLKNENQSLAYENKKLKDENTTLKVFKEKVVTFFKSVANTIPNVRDFINSRLPEIKNEIFGKKDSSLEM
ncbi:hypothetical protein [Campylobacter concisus]|uniref:hypothetical protein n=1 Tax=Campylobacter concisus TaxID=199 RepID=UPI0011E60F38|nr:hypothetical protein [Campylobacter concisus]